MTKTYCAVGSPLRYEECLQNWGNASFNPSLPLRPDLCLKLSYRNYKKSTRIQKISLINYIEKILGQISSNII